ncbi:Asp-tRNA(Asn)/Glu-tRNA(Gln) amidotransferase subunit GatA [Candidatus Berkelbacteria bacterium]|nr:Asp-tRNA(Asn)/Glu-tRNA(Gln) amidotransferase subunit GatA [Candidatus Berkelbacteria bacterium]
MVIKTITQANEALEKGELRSIDLVNEHFDRINEHDSKIKSFLTLNKEEALAQAQASDRRRAESKSLGDLDGIPVSIKDIVAIKNLRTTASSNLLANFVPAYDATVVKKLKEAGAVILGKVNCDAWAHGSSTENSDFGPSKNPWDLERIPGGSSGGSTAAVAAGFGLASIGTDTGGSIRQPASLCGVTGLKPTYGRVSRYGLIAMASSLDCPGPITRSAEDAALMMRVIAGQDYLDSTTLPEGKFPEVNVDKDGNAPLKGLRVGLPKEYFADGLDSEVAQVVEEAIDQFKKLGAEFKEVSLPTTKNALAVYYVIMPAEVSSNLARFDGIRYGVRSEKAQNLAEIYDLSRSEGFGAEAKRRIMMGTYVLSSGYYDAYYKKAMQVRTLIIEDFHRVFDEVDLLLTPTSPTPAWKMGEKTEDPLTMYLADIYTVSANLAGIPGISVPCGFVKQDSSQLPVGLQLLGNQLDEDKILRAAIAYQQATDWHLRDPEF